MCPFYHDSRQFDKLLRRAVLDEFLFALYNSHKIGCARKDNYMNHIYDELNSAVDAFYQKYKDLNNDITSKRIGADNWTLKEIIGHLIDSACNNHQRFVRLQIVDELIFPGFGKYNSKWIQIAGYNEMNFSDLMLLWKQYNILIDNIIKVVDESKLEHRWKNPEGDKKTLSDLMIDYVRHLKDHLQHFEQTLRAINR